jgi:heme exporter protein CcmD
MNQDSLINTLSMGDHGFYVWIVVIVLFTILGSTITLINRKIRQTKKEINEEG